MHLTQQIASILLSWLFKFQAFPAFLLASVFCVCLEPILNSNTIVCKPVAVMFTAFSEQSA